MKRKIILFLIFGVNFIINSQSKTDTLFSKNYQFHPPLSIELVLAGNFGELRSNHFHTGIDFKTQHKEGLNIYSIEKGYVSRIKSGPWGYGKVIYIDHPEINLTSVYAHLKGFPDKIDTFLKDAMKTQQKNELDLYPGKNQLTVKKGEIIGISGNTGGSTAPHLHFEIRQTDTEEPLNPLLFNFDVPDHKSPYLFGIKFYTIDKNGYITKSTAPYYRVGNDKIKDIELSNNFVKKGEKLVMGIDAVDYLDGAGNKCGIYTALLKHQNDTLFFMELERLKFSTNRYINCHMDYFAYKEERKNIHKMYIHPINQLNIYGNTPRNIIPGIKNNGTYDIEITDVYKNKTSFKFNLKYKTDSDSLLYDASTYLSPELPHIIKKQNLEIIMPSHCFYEPISPKVQITEGGVSEHYTIENSDVPIHQYFTVRMTPNLKKIKNLDKEKLFIYVMNDRGYRRAHKTYWIEGQLEAEVRSFGTYGLEIDTLPPIISTKNFRDGQTTGRKTLTFKIKDDFSGIDSYQAEINGNWEILDYEPKRGGTYSLDVSDYKSGELTIKITAKDLCNNKTTNTYTIERK